MLRPVPRFKQGEAVKALYQNKWWDCTISRYNNDTKRHTYGLKFRNNYEIPKHPQKDIRPAVPPNFWQESMQAARQELASQPPRSELPTPLPTSNKTQPVQQRSAGMSKLRNNIRNKAGMMNAMMKNAGQRVSDKASTRDLKQAQQQAGDQS